MKIEIRDTREKSFLINDEYLNGYAKLCGVYATAVYNSLCRHADKEQKCFPSIKLIAEEHNIGERTVIRAVRKLEEYNIIVRQKTRTKNGKWLNNLYYLRSKCVWKKKPSATQAGGSQVPENTEPSAREYHSQVPHRHTKETHKEGNTYKETHPAEQGSALIVETIKEFELVDIKNKTYYGNTTQRKACEFLIDNYGFEKVKTMIQLLPKTNTMEYIPHITTPVQLRDKWVQLVSGLQRLQNKQNAEPKVLFS